MFESLTQRLSHAVQRMSGRGRITEENIRDVARDVRYRRLIICLNNTASLPRR